MIAKRLLWALVAFAVLALFAPSFSTTAFGDDEQSLVGAWHAQFTDVLTPPTFPPIDVLITFNDDQTLTETDTSSLMPSPLPAPFPPTALFYSSPGHGVWKKIGERTYAIKYRFPIPSLPCRK